MPSDLTHARHDPAHVLAPGLFRSLAPGDRKRLKLDARYSHGQDALEFWGREPLGVDDLRVLQGLVAMAGPKGVILRSEARDDASEGVRQLALDLFNPPELLAQADRESDALVVRSTLRSLARAIGVDEGGKGLTMLRRSIERLYSVTVIVERGRKRVGTRLLSSYASDEGTGDVYIALSPRLTQAILGDRQHVRIDLAEVRALKTDPARLIHQRLCGWIDQGKSGKATLTTLASYVWPDEGNPALVRFRRGRVRKALEELRGMAWTVTEDKDGNCRIGRPRAAKE